MRKVINFLNFIEENLLGLGLLALAVYAFVQVVCRYFFHINFTSFEEVSRYGNIFLAFMGASLSMKYGQLFCMKAVILAVKPKYRKPINIVTWLLCAFFMGFVTYFGIKLIIKYYNFGNITAALEIPTYVPYLPLTFFCFVMCVRSLIIVWRLVTNAITDEQPQQGEVL